MQNKTIMSLLKNERVLPLHCDRTPVGPTPRSQFRVTHSFSTTSIIEPHRTKSPVSIPKFIAGLSRNPILTTEIRHSLPRKQTTDKTHAFTHDRTLFPWHKILLYAPVSCVTHVPCIICYLCTLIGPNVFKMRNARPDPFAFAIAPAKQNV